MADKKTPGGGQGQNSQPNGPNERANNAAKSSGLNADQKRELHDRMKGENMTYQQIKDIAEDIKKGQ